MNDLLAHRGSDEGPLGISEVSSNMEGIEVSLR